MLRNQRDIEQSRRAIAEKTQIRLKGQIKKIEQKIEFIGQNIGGYNRKINLINKELKEK